MEYRQLINFAWDFLLTIWFFRPVKPYPGVKRARKVMSMLLFLTLIPIYLTAFSYKGSVAETMLRFALRFAVFAIYVHEAKGRRWDIALCMAAFAWLTFTAGNNIILTPTLYAVRMKELALTANPILNFIICDVLEFVLYGLLITAVSRLISMDTIRQTPISRVQILLALAGIETYVKMSLAGMDRLPLGEAQTTLTIYPLLLQLLILVALVFFERLMYNRMQQEQAHIENQAREYRLEYAKVSSDADTSIRQLHHDLRNHLNTILRLSGDNERLDSYVKQLLEDGFENYESLIATGNTLLDGLVSGKIRRARQESIEVSCNVDFRNGGFLSDSDICTIFGNALDNAIEASLRVKDTELRSILLRCGSMANNLVISVSNYFEGELRLGEGTLLSSKPESGHGLGLNGIRRTVQQYGGTVVFTTDELHNFILTISLPLPD